MNASPYNRQALPVADWPEKDRTDWKAACAPEASWLSSSAAVRWRPATRELYVRNYGMWLDWLAREHRLPADSGPGERMTRKNFVAYLQERQRLGNNAKTLANHAAGLRHMIEALDPDRDWAWMNEIISTLNRAVKRTEKHTNLPSIRELFNLGLATMQYAEVLDRSLFERAIIFRNGLAIAMLAARPLMRRNNISLIRIGEHLICGDGIYQLRFSADEMKGRRARGGPLPEILKPKVDRYLKFYRPRLLGDGPDTEDAMWISAMNRPIAPHAFSHEIGKVTEAAFGRRITMHEFRHAAASSIAKEDPEHVGIVTTINGHASFATSERYYIIAEEHAAFKRYHKALDRLVAGIGARTHHHT